MSEISKQNKNLIDPIMSEIQKLDKAEASELAEQAIRSIAAQLIVHHKVDLGELIENSMQGFNVKIQIEKTSS